MNTDVFNQLSGEHDTLLPLIVEIQAAAETEDIPALLKHLANGRAALTSELDAHIALEEDVAFAAVDETLGEGMARPFREEHKEIQSLRDRVLAGAEAGRVSIDLCLQLCDLIQEHMQREDEMLFPSMRAALESA